jgi:hypothetical protein
MRTTNARRWFATCAALLTVAATESRAQNLFFGRGRPTRVKTSAYTVTLPRAEAPPKIDGVGDDPIWQSAARITNFVQAEPEPGATPSDSTITLVTYDREKLYILVNARGDPAKIRALVTKRDETMIGGGYDGITLRLDTFDDARRAYVLQVNPKGVQQDYVMREGEWGGMTDDFVWFSAARITPTGYVVEVAIPFSSLSFPNARSFDIGFNVLRDYGGTYKQDSWAPRKRGNPCDICQEGTLSGIKDVFTRQTLDFRPYVMAASSRARNLDMQSISVAGTDWPAVVPGKWADANNQSRTGLDVRWAMTSAFAVNATIHPDFSQVEADPAQVTVNTRFAIYYPERRPFFTTESDVFKTAGYGATYSSLFHSRDIADPFAGVRLTGKSGALSIAGLYARDQHPAYYHYSGAESSGLDPAIGGPADVGVLRVRRDIRADSYVGMLVTDREHGEAFNRVVAADMRLRLGSVVWLAEASHSEDRLPLQTSSVDSVGGCPYGFTLMKALTPNCRSDRYDGAQRSGNMIRSALSYNSASVNANVSAAQITPDFRTQLGNFGRVGIEQFSSYISFSQRPKSMMLYEGISASAVREYGGKLLDYSVSTSLSFSTPGGSGFGIGPYRSHSAFGGRMLDVNDISLSGYWNVSKHMQLSSGIWGGGQVIYDYANPRVGRGWSWGLWPSFTPTPSLSIIPNFSRSEISETSGSKVLRADVFSLTAQYQQTAKLGWRVTSQYLDQWTSLTPDPLMQRNGFVQSSLLLTYEIAPTSFAYLGFNDQRQRFDAPVLPSTRFLSTGTRLFFKMSYLVRK